MLAGKGRQLQNRGRNDTENVVLQGMRAEWRRGEKRFERGLSVWKKEKMFQEKKKSVDFR